MKVQLASQEGVEPPTPSLGGACSIHLSYWDMIQGKKKWRTREDSNLQPPESESVTLSIELRAQHVCIIKEYKANCNNLTFPVILFPLLDIPNPVCVFRHFDYTKKIKQ